jgi:hypothetical protein
LSPCGSSIRHRPTTPQYSNGRYRSSRNDSSNRSESFWPVEA